MTTIEKPGNLLYRIGRGDERAFDLFMAQWTQHLYHYAMSMLGSKEIAEEVVSDVFLQVWKSREKLIEIEYMGQWLRTVTYCKVINKLRAEAGRPTFVSLDDIDTFILPQVEAPDESILSHEQQEAVNEALETLPPKCKHVFFLAKIERMPYKQIATMLNISLSTVNYHVAYAMEHLRSRLNRQADNEQ